MNIQIKPAAIVLIGLLSGLSHGDTTLTLQLLLCIALHELGHVLAACLWRVRITGVGLSWMGIYIRRGAAAMPWQEAFIAFSGPAVNLLIALGTSGVMSQFNWAMFLVNMAPIPGSDGMRILRSLRAVAQPIFARVTLAAEASH